MSESTSIFATKATNATDVARLVDNLDRFMPEGLADTKAIAEQPIKYSRAWLILRRAYLEQNAKSLLWEPTKASIAKAEKTFSANDPKWLERHVYGPKVHELHDEGCSWGEIMVRLGKSEGFVRKAFEATDGQRRSVGLRTGKGGRFAADRPDLYQENRRHEGAEVPNEKGIYASTVPVEMLLNFQPQEA